MADGPIEPEAAGDYPSDMEARVAVLEQIARTTAAALDRIERRLDTSVERIEQRLDRAEAASRAEFHRIEQRFDQTEAGNRAEFQRIETRLGAIEANARADYRWVLGIMLGGFAGLLGVMAHGFHWL
jgi:hypothetical protein